MEWSKIKLGDSLLKLASLAILLILTACHPQETPNSINKKAVVEEVQTMFDNYHNAIKEKGLMGEFDYLDQTDDFFWVPPGFTNSLTFEAVKNILGGNVKGLSHVEFQWDTLQIFPLTNEIANYTGTVSGMMTDTSGISSTVSIIESGTVIKRNDGWKLLSGQSANLPAKASN